MWLIVTDWIAWSVGLSVCGTLNSTHSLSVCRLCFCYDREPCKKRLNRSRCRLGCVLEWVQVIVSTGGHWRHLADTIKLPVCGGDAALLSNNFDHLLFIVVGIIVSSLYWMCSVSNYCKNMLSSCALFFSVASKELWNSCLLNRWSFSCFIRFVTFT